MSFRTVLLALVLLPYLVAQPSAGLSGAAGQPEQPSAGKGVIYASRYVSTDYFGASTHFAQYYIDQMTFLNYGARFIHFARYYLCQNVHPLTFEFHELIRGMLPHAFTLPSHYQIQPLIFEMDSRLKNRSSFSLILRLANMILGMVEDELRGLVNVEWDDVTEFYYSSLHRQAAQEQVLPDLSRVAQQASSQCHQQLQVVSRISTLLNLLPPRFARLEHLTQQQPNLFPRPDASGSRLASAQGTGATTNFTPVAYGDEVREQAEAIWKTLQQEQTAWAKRVAEAEAQGYLLSATMRDDGLPDTSEFMYPVPLQARITLQTNKDLTAVSRIEVHWTNQDGSPEAEFLMSRLWQRESLVEQFIRERLRVLLPLLPRSVQLQSAQRPVLLRAAVHIGLRCNSQRSPGSLFNGALPAISTTEYVYLSFPRVLATPQRVAELTRFSLSSSTPAELSAAISLISSYARLLSTDPQAYGSTITSKSVMETQGVCLTPVSSGNLAHQKGNQHPASVRYPATFKTEDPGHLVWPTCLGAYPAGTEILIKVPEKPMTFAPPASHQRASSFANQAPAVSQPPARATTLGPEPGMLSVGSERLSKPPANRSKKPASSMQPRRVGASWNPDSELQKSQKTTTFNVKGKRLIDETSFLQIAAAVGEARVHHGGPVFGSPYVSFLQETKKLHHRSTKSHAVTKDGGTRHKLSSRGKSSARSRLSHASTSRSRGRSDSPKTPRSKVSTRMSSAAASRSQSELPLRKTTRTLAAPKKPAPSGLFPDDQRPTPSPFASDQHDPHSHRYVCTMEQTPDTPGFSDTATAPLLLGRFLQTPRSD